MTEYENEPIPGLPGIPPPGERILWQGSPDWRVLARTAFHVRLFGAYFTVLVGVAAFDAIGAGVRSASDLTGVALTVGLAVAGLALLHLLAWASARSTIYTLTDRRIVFRLGIAVPKCVNLPLGMVNSVDLAVRADGSGDLPLALNGQPKLGYLLLWPSARPWKVARPRPMLRAIPQAADVAELMTRACLAASGQGRIIQAEPRPTETRAAAFVAAVAA